jgi:hypothetical protein
MPADMRYHLPREAGTQHLSHQQVTMHPHRHQIPFLSFLAPAPTTPLHTRTPLSWTRVVIVRTSVHLIATQAIRPACRGARPKCVRISWSSRVFCHLSLLPLSPTNTRTQHARRAHAHAERARR